MLALNTQSRQQADDAMVIGVDVIVLCADLPTKELCAQSPRVSYAAS